MSARRWAIGLAAIGLGVSVYLTAVHYSQATVPLLCSTSGLVNCEEVTTSPSSMVGPAPVAVLGLLWFVATLALLAWRGSARGPWPLVRVLWGFGGVLAVFYLIYAELFLAGAICLWCTVVHVVVIGLFLIGVAEASP